ncbi:hypothetical protein DSM16313_24720 [Acinetobacter seohaensis]|nr:hypothetical protein DSM16313_24720 [Acinetobacter seohaensis]
MQKNQQKKRDDIEIIRVKLWYEMIKSRLSLASSYQIEKVLEPMSFKRNDNGERYNNNKWSKYQSGLHTPNSRSISLVESQVPESSKMINSIFWEALRGEKEVDWLIKKGEEYLPWNIKRILYQPNKNGLSYELVNNLNSKQIHKLENFAGLDSLAALIIFLRFADSKNYRTAAFDIGCSIYRLLLVASTFPYYREHNAELLQLMKRYVFPLAHDGTKCVAVENEEGFSLEVEYLNNALLELEHEREGHLTQKQKIHVMLDMIHGSGNFIHKLIFFIPFEIKDDPSVDNVPNLLEIQKMKKWTIECLKRGIAPLSIDSVEFSPFSH